MKIPASTLLNQLLAASILASAMTLSASVMAADPKNDDTGYRRILDSVTALSMALQSDPSPKAKAALTLVQRKQKEAGELAGVGEFDLAKSILDEGYKTLTSTLVEIKKGTGAAAGATPAADSKPVEKSLQEFDKDVLVATTMLDALKKQNIEKKAKKDTLIAEIEQKIVRAKSLRNSDVVSATKLAGEAYTSTREAIQSMQPVGGGKVAPDRPSEPLAKAPSGDEKTARLAKALHGTTILRSALARISGEQKVDMGATLARVDQLLVDARRLEKTDSTLALKTTEDAYQVAKSGIEKALGK